MKESRLAIPSASHRGAQWRNFWKCSGECSTGGAPESAQGNRGAPWSAPEGALAAGCQQEKHPREHSLEHPEFPEHSREHPPEHPDFPRAPLH